MSLISCDFVVQIEKCQIQCSCACAGNKSKVKCTLVHALRLCTGRTAHRGSRSITLLFLDHGTSRVWEVSVTPQPIFTPGKDPVPNEQEAGWAPGPVWTGEENIVPIGIRAVDRPARRQSLYRLRYPAHCAGNRCQILKINSDKLALVFRRWTGMGRTSEVKETCNHAIGIPWESLNTDRQGLKIQSSERWSVQITLESAMCLWNRKIGKKQEGGEGVWNPRPIFQF